MPQSLGCSNYGRGTAGGVAQGGTRSALDGLLCFSLRGTPGRYQLPQREDLKWLSDPYPTNTPDNSNLMRKREARGNEVLNVNLYIENRFILLFT